MTYGHIRVVERSDFSLDTYNIIAKRNTDDGYIAVFDCISDFDSVRTQMLAGTSLIDMFRFIF